MTGEQRAAEFTGLRESADLLHRWGCDVVASTSMMSDYDIKQIAHAADEVGLAYRIEHPAGDDAPVTEEWLRSVGAIGDEWHMPQFTFHRKDALPVGLWRIDDEWKAMLIYGEHAASCIVRGLKARGDVRLLCRALRIPLNE